MTDSHFAPPSPASDEPETPAWLPALGFVLMVVGGLAWAVTPPTAQASAPEAAASVRASDSVNASADAARRPTPPPAPPTAHVPASAAPIVPPPPPFPPAGVAPRDKVGRPAKKHP